MIVYAIYNLVNGKIYIGKTEKADLNYRWKQHCVSAFTTNSQYYIHRALRKYGKGAFIVVRISDAPCREDLDPMERYFIEKYRSNDPRFGYNMTAGGEGHSTPHTDETKRLMSKRHLGVPLSSSHRENMVFGNRTEEAKEKNRLSHLGINSTPERIASIKAAWTPEKRAAFSERLRQNPSHIPSSDEKEKSSKRLLAQWSDDGWKKRRVENIRKARRGTVWRMPNFADIVKCAKTISEIARACGLRSGNHAQVLGRIEHEGLDISHIRRGRAWNRGLKAHA